MNKSLPSGFSGKAHDTAFAHFAQVRPALWCYRQYGESYLLWLSRAGRTGPVILCPKVCDEAWNIEN